MRRFFFPLLCGALFALYAACPAFAGNADKLNGTWVMDEEATKALMREKPAAPPIREEELRRARAVRLTFDIPGRMFIAEFGGESRRMPIDGFIDNLDGSVRVEGKGLGDVYVFQPDGTIRLKGDPLVLKKVPEKAK